MTGASLVAVTSACVGMNIEIHGCTFRVSLSALKDALLLRVRLEFSVGTAEVGVMSLSYFAD